MTFGSTICKMSYLNSPEPMWTFSLTKLNLAQKGRCARDSLKLSCGLMMELRKRVYSTHSSVFNKPISRSLNVSVVQSVQSRLYSLYSLGCTAWWAASVATYCPSRMVEHPKCNSTQPSHSPDVPDCTESVKKIFSRIREWPAEIHCASENFILGT